MLGGIGSFFKGLFSGGSSQTEAADSSGGDTSGRNSQMEVSAEVGADGGYGGSSSLVQSLTRQSQTSSLPPPPPPPSRTTNTTGTTNTAPSSAAANVAARDGIDRAGATAAALHAQFDAQTASKPLGPPPIPPGRIPTLTNTTPDNAVFRQVVDTTGINTNAADVNRQVAYQSLRQLGLSDAQATSYMNANPNFTIRSNAGTGNETATNSVSAQAATGRFDNNFTAATLREIQSWLGSASNSLPQVAAQPRINTAPVAAPSPPASPFASNTTAALTPNVARNAPPPPPPPSTASSPQREQNLEGISSFVEGAVLGNFSTNNSYSAIAGNIVGGLNPIADARDVVAGAIHVYQAREGAWIELGTSALGAIPIVGDIGRTLVRGGERIAANAAERAVTEGIQAAERGATSAVERAVAEQSSRHGVYFFGEDVLPYIDRPNATLGQTGNAHFFMPLEDSVNIRSVSDAARASGNARSITQAYISGGRGFGVAFPLGQMPTSVPTMRDANGWAHFFGGGRTAVRTAEPNGGFLINTTRELVTPGGNQIPSGSVLFEIGPNGSQIPMRRY